MGYYFLDLVFVFRPPIVEAGARASARKDEEQRQSLVEHSIEKYKEENTSTVYA